MCVGVPCKILHRENGTVMPMGAVDMAGSVRRVCLAYVPEAHVGDYVLIQNGFAITTLSEHEALESIATWQELGVLDENGIAIVSSLGEVGEEKLIHN